MEVFRAYAFATAGYLAAQALPLLVAPRGLAVLAGPEPQRARSGTSSSTTTTTTTTDLESHLSRALALALLTLALLVLLLTGAIPLHEHAKPAGSADPHPARLRSPFTKATLVVTTTYHACTACLLYTRLAKTVAARAVTLQAAGWMGALGVGWLLSAALAGVGLWVLVFGGEAARLPAWGSIVSGTRVAEKKEGGSAVPVGLASPLLPLSPLLPRDKRREKDRGNGGDKEADKKDKERGKDKERREKKKDRERDKDSVASLASRSSSKLRMSILRTKSR